MQHFEDFAQMQRDAERRVMEMQKRAMAAVENTDISLQEKREKNEKPVASHENPHESHRAPLNKQHIIPGLNISDEDSEKALLIIILLLLLREDADERLILTLLYILM